MSQIRLQAQGATMQHITKPEFEAIEIPVPTMETQRAIVGRVTAQLGSAESARVASVMRREATLASAHASL